jgi:hypothetical protein
MSVARGAALAMAAACVLPFSALAQGDDPAAAPPGIAPVTMTLAHLLQLHRAAVGTPAAGKPYTATETWKISQGELDGTRELVVSGDDYREDVTLGPFHTASGDYGGKQWLTNKNGETRAQTGLHLRDDIDDAALANAAKKNSGVTLLGSVAVPLAAYVVKVAPEGGRTEYVYYDRTTFLITRIDRAVEDRRVVTMYDDFRTTGGVTSAWHIHTSNGLAGDDRDARLQALETGKTVDAGKLTMPPSRMPFSIGAAPVSLPATISGDRVIVTVQFGAHKVNLQLDSGASSVLLDRSVADAVHVPSYGKKTEETAGLYTASDALVPKMQIGSIDVENFAVETAPFTTLTYDGSPVAGLLGYDFIAGCVVKIDYVKGEVQAIDPAAFAPPAGAVALPIRLDDGVPVIAAAVSSATGKHFVVDTGADRSMIFSAFAKAHPQALADQGLGEEIDGSFPFVNKIMGVGGKVAVREVQVQSLRLGTIELPKWLFSVSQDAPAFESEDYDGLIGQDVLRNFDVYFDYSRSMMYLLPNERFRQRWGSV